MTADTLTLVRWPLAPLLASAGNPPVAQLARQVGVATRTVWRWQLRGLTDTQADRAAVALGLHPANIWDHWYQPDHQ
ncbi:MAG: helix-turn-helix domain-containing protein [Acidimicrobiia bacterium]|nr:helix-turn-helix domain-containing protein [Acidimicrobiia bacterium]